MKYANKTLYVSPNDVTVWVLNDQGDRGPIVPRSRDGEVTHEWTGKGGKQFYATVGLRNQMSLTAQDKANGLEEYEVIYPALWGEISEDGTHLPPSGQIDKVVLE